MLIKSKRLKFTIRQVKAIFNKRYLFSKPPCFICSSFPLWSFPFLFLPGYSDITSTLGNAPLSQRKWVTSDRQQWWGKMAENRVGSNRCCTAIAIYSRCLKWVKLFWFFPKQEIREQWPTGNVPWRRKKITFVLWLKPDLLQGNNH